KNTGTQHNDSTTASPSPSPSKISNKATPPKITATNPVAHNATTTNTVPSQITASNIHSNTTARVPSQITATNPVAHNATTLIKGSGGGHPCSGKDLFLWDHVY